MFYTGTLESTSHLFSEVDFDIGGEDNMEIKKKLFYNGKEIKRDEEKSLISLGIRENFTFIVEVNYIPKKAY